MRELSVLASVLQTPENESSSFSCKSYYPLVHLTCMDWSMILYSNSVKTLWMYYLCFCCRFKKFNILVMFIILWLPILTFSLENITAKDVKFSY